MVRIFICIWIPEKTKEKIVEAQEYLKKHKINAKYVEKENLHLTLSFLGEIEENEIKNLKKILTNTLGGFNKFHVKISGIMLIPNNNIRVIGIRTMSQDLVEVKNKINKELKIVNNKSSKITLCRLRNKIKKSSIKDFINKYRDYSFGEIHVKKISVVKSELTKKGPIYKTIYEVKLNE